MLKDTRKIMTKECNTFNTDRGAVREIRRGRRETGTTVTATSYVVFGFIVGIDGQFTKRLTSGRSVGAVGSIFVGTNAVNSRSESDLMHWARGVNDQTHSSVADLLIPRAPGPD